MDLHDATTQKNTNIYTAMRTTNLTILMKFDTGELQKI